MKRRRYIRRQGRWFLAEVGEADWYGRSYGLGIRLNVDPLGTTTSDPRQRTVYTLRVHVLRWAASVAVDRHSS